MERLVFQNLVTGVAHELLTCMPTTRGSSNHSLGLQYQMAQASKTYHANPWILQNWQLSITHRLRLFQSAVDPALCYGRRQRTIHKPDLGTISTERRKLVRRIVSPHGHIDWSAQWPIVRYEWHAFAEACMEATIKRYSNGENNERFCGYVAKLPLDRWAIRAETPCAGKLISYFVINSSFVARCCVGWRLLSQSWNEFFVDFAYDGLTWL